MSQQIKNGVSVSLLYPADIHLFRKKITIKQANNFGKVSVYRLINPLPIPLIYGVDSVKHYIHYDRSVDFNLFFVKNKFDVIHIHTLMGLPLEFIVQAKKLGIRIVYTTHDTFGIWPEPDMNNRHTGIDPIFSLGYIGNQKILKYSQIVIMQSTAYKLLKKYLPLEFIKRLLRSKSNHEQEKQSLSIRLRNKQLYTELRRRYAIYFNLFDTIHFNSELTEEVFNAYGIRRPGFVSYVYHSHINITPNTERRKTAADNKLRLLYNGTREQYKGYTVLLSIFDEINKKKPDGFKLIVYGTETPDRDYIEAHPSYNIADIEKVYSSVDVTLVPSMCYETFGMVVPESLSYGTPVIASCTVGSKSLLANGLYGTVFNSKKELQQLIEGLMSNATILVKQQKSIKCSHKLRFDAKLQYDTITQAYLGRI